MDTLTVTVTKDHIKRAGHSNTSCPIALAAREQLGNIIVGHYRIFVVNKQNETIHMYSLPPEATEFIRRFDKGEAVEPQTFTFERV